MADNFNFTAGVGSVGASDDVGGVHYPKVKLVDGTADSSTIIAVDVGVKANALRVAPANDITDATYIGDIKFGEAEPNSAAILADTTAILADTAAIQTAVELLDNAVDGNYLNVNANIAGTDIVGGAGAVAAGVQRITLASDDPAVVDLAAIEVLQTTIAGDTTSIDGKITACNTGAVVLSSGTVTTVSTVTNLSQLGGTAISMNEGVLDAGVQRVTLATDDDSVAHLATIAGDTTSIDGKITACNTGAVTISAALPAGTNAIGKLAANTGVDIGDVDVTSVVPGTAATNLGKAEDAAHTTGDVGVMALTVRFDAGGALAGTDGDYAPLQVDANGALRVTGGGGGTEYTEDVATANPIVGSAVMMERDDIIATLTPVEGDWASLRCSAEGALWVQDFNSDAALALLGTIDADTNTIAGDTTSIDGKITACNTGAVVLAASDGTDIGNVDVTSIVPGTAATNLGKARDSAMGATDTGVMALAVRDDALTTLTPADGDYVPLRVNSTGALHMTGTVTTVSTVTNLSQFNGVAINMGEGVLGAGTQRVTLATDDDGVTHLATIAGDTTNIETAIQIIDDWDATHDGAASADGPQLMAAYDSTKPTAVGDGDAVRVLADSYGRLLAGVEPTRFQAVFDSADATAEANVVHASAASTIIVVQSYVISSDVEGWIKLQDEDSTALTGKFWLKAGGGVAITLPDNAPIVLGVDKDLEVICEAAGNVSVSVTGYTIPG